MTVPQPRVVGSIIELHPDQIDASDRLLPIDPVWADAVGLMMKTDGQLTPVDVRLLPGRSDYKLVVGGHRHAGAVAHGLMLEARIVSNDGIQSRLREASENVQRRDLSPIDRAKSIAELVEVHKAAAGIDPEMKGQTVAINARWQKSVEDEADDTSDTMSLVYGWADAAAEKAGVTRRTVYRDLELLRRIPASIAEALRSAGHPVFHNAGQLKALAGLQPAEQSKVLGLLLHADAAIAGAPFQKVTDAIGAMRGRTTTPPPQKRLNTFVDTFSRMPLTEKKGALAELGERLPKGFRIVEGDAPRAAFPPEHERYRDEALEAIDQVRELLDGLIEDEKLDDERHSIAGVLAAKLQMARLTIAGNGIPLGGDA